MPGKELRIIPRIAREPEFDMDLETIREFTFTDDELREKAREFLGR